MPASVLHRRRAWRNPPWRMRGVVQTALAQTQDWGIGWGGLPVVWRISRGSAIKVAVLDTGCDLTHPDLQSQVIAARDFSGSPYGAQDRQGHGTHVAGTIAAVDNSVGVIGVAPQARLIVGKVLGDDGSGAGDAVAAGIDWAVEQGADLISMSLGSPEPDPAIHGALRRAVQAGKFVVAAAGNDGQPNSVGYPAAWDDLAVCVGAIDEHGQLANFSSLGRQLDVAAPGVDILSCWPGGRYAKLSGTSMATPFVAGVVALLLSHCRTTGACPQSQTELIDRLRGTATDAGPTGPDTGFGWGLVNPGKLLAAATKPAEPPSGGVPNISLRIDTVLSLDGRALPGAFVFVPNHSQQANR